MIKTSESTTLSAVHYNDPTPLLPCSFSSTFAGVEALAVVRTKVEEEYLNLTSIEAKLWSDFQRIGVKTNPSH